MKYEVGCITKHKRLIHVLQDPESLTGASRTKGPVFMSAWITGWHPAEEHQSGVVARTLQCDGLHRDFIIPDG